MKKESFGSFRHGFRLWFRGAYFIFNNISLWKYLILPVMVNFIIITLIFIFGFGFLSDKLPDLSFPDLIKPEGWLIIWYYLKGSFIYLFRLILWILTLVFIGAGYVLIFILTTTITGSPFYDMLSDRIERLKGLRSDEKPFSFRSNIIYPLGSALKMTLFEFLIIIMFFPVSWIPLLGGFAYIVIVSFPLAMSMTAYSFERRYIGFWDQLKKAWALKWVYTGFGVAAFISMIPFGLNIITFPLSVAGATLLFIEGKE